MDADVTQYLEKMEGRIVIQRSEYIDERTHEAETWMVREFGTYWQWAAICLCQIEADLSNVNSSTTQQMDVLQAKLLGLETRIINLERPQG